MRLDRRDHLSTITASPTCRLWADLLAYSGYGESPLRDSAVGPRLLVRPTTGRRQDARYTRP